MSLSLTDLMKVWFSTALGYVDGSTISLQQLQYDFYASGGVVGLPYQFKPESYGALCDAYVINDVVTTAASATINSASGGFTNLTTGMSAVVSCGSAAGAPQYVTLTKVSNTQATMSAVATSSVTCIAAIGTDDSVAVNDCVAAAHAYALANDGYASIVLSGYYGLGSAPVIGIGTTLGNAYIPLPLVATTARKVTLEFVGPNASALAHWQQTMPQVVGGGFIVLNGSGVNDADYGPTVIIGGPVFGYKGTTNFNNMLCILNGVNAIVPWNGLSGGFDFIGTAEVIVKDAGAFALAIPGAGAVPTMGTPASFSNFGFMGLRMPQSTNNAVTDILFYRCEGLVNGLWASEHTTWYSIHIIYCYAGIVPYHGSGGAMSNRIIGNHACVEACVHGIATVENAGVTVRMDIDHMTGETLTDVVNDANSNLEGYVRFAGYAVTLDATTVSTNPNFTLYDSKVIPGIQTPPAVPATTVALRNTFYADCDVAITAGASTCAVAINGSAFVTIPIAGVCTIKVPSNSTITLTYTAAPTWKWIATK